MPEDPRKKLESILESLWKTPEFEKIRNAYDSAAGSKRIDDSYGACLAKLMEEGRAGREAYEECAKKYNIGKNYAAAWGE